MRDTLFVACEQRPAVLAQSLDRLFGNYVGQIRHDLLKCYRKIGIVIDPHPVAIDMIGIRHGILEPINGLQRSINAALHVVLDIVIHRRTKIIAAS